MRENSTHGSEGGESREALLYPYQRPGMAICESGMSLNQVFGNHQVTVHGLDSGILAGMTGLLCLAEASL